MNSTEVSTGSEKLLTILEALNPEDIVNIERIAGSKIHQAIALNTIAERIEHELMKATQQDVIHLNTGHIQDLALCLKAVLECNQLMK